MKRAIFLMLALAMTLCFAGCGNKDVASVDSESATPSATPIKEAGLTVSTDSKPTETPTPELTPEPEWWEELDGNTMKPSEYPNWGEWVSEESFNKAIKRKDSNFEPDEWDSFTWSNGDISVQLYQDSMRDDIPMYGMKIWANNDYSSEPSTKSRSSIIKPCTVNVADRMISSHLAEDLWDFVALCDMAKTMDDVRPHVFEEGGFLHGMK